jgi:hypothetical protein
MRFVFQLLFFGCYLFRPENLIAQNPSYPAFRQAFPESFLQRYDHSVNNLHFARQKFPSISGKGKVASLKERRFDTLDADLISRVFTTRFTSDISDRHATEMATLMAGNGNTGYNGQGAAWGARLTSASFDNLMPEPEAYYRSNNIMVQNHSYGTGIENFYAEDAAAYDLSMWRDTSLLHVFSAGNRGNATPNDGRFAGLPGFSNLTGSFKMSKNTISVGATDSFFTIETLSSRGPAFDGMLKPELVAFGVDGSSGAAALVSGSALLLQQLLHEQNGAPPPASLVKSLLISGANRHHQPGPDYVYGYGHLNAFNALKLAHNRQYKTGNISNGNMQSFSLMVPPGTATLKITLCWTDTAANTGTTKALVNDLDLSVTGPEGVIFLPWTLSVFPHADSLNKPAIRNRDTLNTTEQVTIHNPLAGNYIISLLALTKTNAPQPWSISWDMENADSFFFTHPLSLTPLEAEEKGLVRWEHSFPENTTGKLEFRYTENNNWITLNNSLQLDQRFTATILPDKIGLMQYRMTIGQVVFQSDTFFLGKPPQFNIGYVCDDTVLIQWQPISGIQQYKVYALGEKLMLPVGITPDSHLKIPMTLSKNDLIAVASLSQQNTAFEYRSPSKAVSFQSVGCYFINFLSQWDNDTGILSFSLGTTYNIGSALLQKQTAGRFETIQTINPVNNTAYSLTDRNLLQGANIYRVVLVLKDGRTVTSDLQTLIQPNTRGWWVYPNPVKRTGRLNIINRWSETDDLFVDIYDAQGRKTSMKLAALIDNSFAVTNLASGMYFLVFHDGKNRIGTDKLIIIP